ncbi:predicted protein [Uncinocarpus reesii 1704]|uniref:Uncharacterized protein n=1 Tax=Uncinocarpus reesii (strain UAMH 1704) TaxID=336963 RepID=C4JZP2_UNCRE|nr:uncharacterized protein UREG_07643 [Uncinocarpus reesii 1704]EEP82778.1 predicted protein [Uncinocarpus reesii 1704]
MFTSLFAPKSFSEPNTQTENTAGEKKRGEQLGRPPMSHVKTLLLAFATQLNLVPPITWDIHVNFKLAVVTWHTHAHNKNRCKTCFPAGRRTIISSLMRSSETSEVK